MDRTVKNAEISRRILAKIAEGMSVRAAIDAVLGDGTVDRVISDVYDTMRAS